MIKGGTGGANTKTGLLFEEHVDLATLLAKQPGYSVKGEEVYYKGELVARVFKKHAFYRYIARLGVDWRKHLSKQLLPDNCIYVIVNNTLYIIEVKFQNCSGSVDEKLQTCDYKKKRYQKLLAELNYEIEYVYVLSDWFKDPGYKDTLEYIISVGCKYYFNYIPLQKLGLPVPDEETSAP